MRIGVTSGVTTAASGFGRTDRVVPIDAAASGGRDAPKDEPSGRALVVVRPPIAQESVAGRLQRHRVHAPFLAHLFAEREIAASGRLVRPPRPQVIAAYERALDRPGLAVPGWLVDAAY
jgi:hypothetical protein